jgi:phage baseplate assembly protein W
MVKGWKFPIETDAHTGKIKTIEDNANIKQSVNLIIRTNVGERKAMSIFGSEMRYFMFGVVDANYITDFKKSVRNSLLRWEPHIEDLQISVNTSHGPVSKIEACIEYTTDISPEKEQVKTEINLNKI